MDKESTLAALGGLMDHIASGQAINVYREGGFFALEVQRNDEPSV